jgi:hypothetical protein
MMDEKHGREGGGADAAADLAQGWRRGGGAGGAPAAAGGRPARGPPVAAYVWTGLVGCMRVVAP